METGFSTARSHTIIAHNKDFMNTFVYLAGDYLALLYYIIIIFVCIIIFISCLFHAFSSFYKTDHKPQI